MPRRRRHGEKLLDECEVFSRYLLSQPPTDYVLDKYREGNAACGLDRPGTRFDRYLLRVARLVPRAADAYARFFAKNSLLRKKLILLLAILENSAPSHRLIDGPQVGGRNRFFVRATVQGLAFLAAFAAGVLLCLPAQAVLGRRG